jgi:hypothetical protein
MNTKKGLKLFTPVNLGSLNLKHRVVMAPLTRSRSEQPGGIPGDLMVRYYSDRASDGGLIIGEATNISLTARGWFGAPGLYTGVPSENGPGRTLRLTQRPEFAFTEFRGVAPLVVAGEIDVLPAKRGKMLSERRVWGMPVFA